MKVSFHTSLLSTVRPPELIPNPSKEERRAGRADKQDALVLLGALRVLVRLCPLHMSNQEDFISQNKTPAYFQETFICRISGM